MTIPSQFPIVCAELLRAGQGVRFRVTGSSMAPSIREGDFVTVAPLVHGGIRPGDVILYESPRGLTAHRVEKCMEDLSAVITRGDASPTDREIVPSSAILGRLERIERDRVERPLRRGRFLSLWPLRWRTRLARLLLLPAGRRPADALVFDSAAGPGLAERRLELAPPCLSIAANGNPDQVTSQPLQAS